MRTAVLMGGLGLLLLAQPAAAIERPLAEIPAPAHAAASAPATPPTVGPGSKIRFANACAAGKRISIVGIGDLLFHADLEKEALTPTSSYRAFWRPVESVLQNADLTYGNFEGTSAEGITTQLEFVKDPGKAWNNRVYSAPPNQLLFNYHPSVVGDLKASGFDVVSTANTHSLDRGPIGIERTIANLQKGGIAVTGTRLRDAVTTPFSTVTTVKGLNIAWLACTYYTNGFIDQHSQVLYCFEQQEQVLAEIKRLAASPEIDAVILTPHWGLEGSPTPEQRQRDLAHDAIEAGATAIIGTHPHVLQPWEKYASRDGREGLIVYSTGNFISAQHRPEQRLGAMVVMELLKQPGAAKARVSAAGYVSSWVVTDVPHRVIEAPHDMPSRFLPVGNRVFADDLPKLPRDCAPDETVAASWGDRPAVTVASLPFPPGGVALAEAKTGAAVRDVPQAIEAGQATSLVAVTAQLPAAQAKPAPVVRIAGLPAIQSLRLPAGPALPITLIVHIAWASPIAALPRGGSRALPAPFQIARLASELTALRQLPAAAAWPAVEAEFRKVVASDDAARLPRRPAVEDASSAPAKKRRARG